MNFFHAIKKFLLLHILNTLNLTVGIHSAKSVEYISLNIIANSLVKEALRQSNGENYMNICQTWVFVLGSSNSFPESESLNVISKPQFDSAQILITTSSVSPEGKNVTSFFDREVPLENILNPLIFGALRFTPNCVSAFIPAVDSSDLLYKLDEVLLNRISRPHNDYFVFIGEEAVLSDFSTSVRFGDLRYKYGLLVNNTEFQDKFINFCSSTGIENTMSTKSIAMFGRKCPAFINGHQFRITSTLSPGMIRYVNDPISGKRISGAGIYFTILEEASFRSNFTFEVQIAGFGGVSGFKKDGVWRGAIGEVFSREMDFALCPTYVGINVQRLHIIDPSAMTTRLSRVFYVRKPNFRTSWKSIFWPLNKYVWFAIIVTLAAALPTYYYAIDLSYRLSHQERRAVPANLLSNVSMTLLQIFLEQGLSIQSWKGLVLRFLLILWILFSYVVGTGYRGNLVSFLTFLERDPIPRTHQELSLSNYKLLFRYYGGVAYQAAINSPDPMHKRIISKSVLVNNSVDCITPAILDKNTACLDFDFTGDFAIATNGTFDPTNPHEDIFTRSIDKDFSTNLVWAFRKYSPLTEFFDKVILISQASGLDGYWIYMDRLASKIKGANWLRSLNESEVQNTMFKIVRDVNSGPKSMNLTSLFVIFTIVVLGYCFGFLLFLFEVSVKLLRALKKRVSSSKKSQIAEINTLASHSTLMYDYDAFRV